MPWKERSKPMLREEFVKAVLSKKLSKSAACRLFKISRPTGDKWLKRAQNGESMEDRSRAPFHTANKIAPDIEQSIVEYRKQYPTIGALKIHRMLETEGFSNLPSTSTINAVFKRNGLITREASLAATPCCRFEKEEPNEMWQGDFKGYFKMQNGERCYPLNIIDDCTRFNLCCDPLPNETFKAIYPSMERIFREYGLPKSFLCDNGNPWGVSQSTGFTRFEIWLMDLGVLTIHGRGLHPQTQGKEESFNKSMKRELLRQNSIADFEDARKKMSDYRTFYNEKRPHHALALDTPTSRYTASKRCYPDRIEEWEYPDDYRLYKIKDTGFLTYKGQGYFLSEAFGGKTIAIRESSHPGCVTLCYRQFVIARLNIDKRVFEFKKIYLAENDPRFESGEK